MKPVLITACLLLSCPLGADTGIELLYITTADNTELVFRVAPERLEATPVWVPETQPLPLSVAEAVAIARDQVGASPAGSDYVVTTIGLTAAYHDEKGPRWFYQVDLAPTEGLTTIYDVRPIVILLDGTTVTPRPRSSG